MVVALLLQVADAVAPPTGSSPPDEVVVIGQRLATWRGTITTTLLGTRCRTDRSTGDAAMDAVGCGAMTACWPAVQRDYEQGQDRHRLPEDRERLKAAADLAFGRCIKAERRVRIAALLAGKRQVAP